MLRWLLIHLVLCLLSIGAEGQADFVRNDGQWPDAVAFRALIPSGALWVEDNALLYQFYDPEILRYLHPNKERPAGNPIYREHSYRVNFPGSNPALGEGKKTKSFYHNYYIGNDSTRWASNVGVFGECIMANLYPGIDLKVYSHAGSLKYDFILRPGSDPKKIALEFEGGVGLQLENGDLIIKTTVNEVREKAPFAYQIIGGIIKEIPCHYVLNGTHLSFDLGEYDPSYPLTLDPEIVFSTFIGSPADNFGFTACDDSQGNLISGALVLEPGYPITVGAYDNSFAGLSFDVGISKFSSDGSNLLYSTYLGGSREETPHSVIADSNDNIIVMGATGSNNFPVSSGAYQNLFRGGAYMNMSGVPAIFFGEHPQGCDIFVTKFTSAGAFSASTYVGSTANDGLNFADQLFFNYGDAFRGEVEVDGADNIFVASTTAGSMPSTAGSLQPGYGGGTTDGVVFKLNPSLTTLLWGTHIGGSGADACYAIEFANNGDILIAGGTKSTNFPHTAGGQSTVFSGQTDGFALRINPSTFQLIAGTFIGTSSYDQAYFIQSDINGDIYVMGQTEGSMPITPGHYGQPNSGQFIRKFNGTLNSIIWNTTIGSGNGEVDLSPTAFLVSNCNQIYFSGWGGGTNSDLCGWGIDCYAYFSSTFGLPITDDAFQPGTDGSDFYLCVLSPDADELIYGSYFGGPFSDEHVDGGTSRFDKNGSVYQAVCAGCGGFSDFPTTPGAWSANNLSSNCNIGVFRFDLGKITAEVEINGPTTICQGSSVQFTNLSSTGFLYDWDFGDGSVSDEFEPTHVFSEPGTYEVTLIVTDALECILPDTATLVVTIISGSEVEIVPVDPICLGQSTQLIATGSPSLHWVAHPTLSNPNIPNPIATPTQTTTYYAVDIGECGQDTAEVTVVVLIPVTDTIVYEDVMLCLGSSVQLHADEGTSWLWSPASSLNNPTIQKPLASPLDTTTYTVVMENACGTATGMVTVNVISAEISVSDGGTICEGGGLPAFATGAVTYEWYPPQFATPAVGDNTILRPDVTTTFTVTGRAENGCYDSAKLEVFVLGAPQIDAGPDQYFDYPGSAYLMGNALGLDYYWTPTHGLSCTECPFPLAFPEEPTWYYLHATDGFGCEGIDSVFVRPYFPVWVPNTITPDNDGINDVFRAYGVDIDEFYLVIYDRWGNQVFQSNDIEQVWDGGINGYYVQNDTYIWIIEYMTAERRKSLTGHVNVVR